LFAPLLQRLIIISRQNIFVNNFFKNLLKFLYMTKTPFLHNIVLKNSFLLLIFAKKGV